MKNTTNFFTAAQEQLHTKMIKRIQVLGQYDGAITDRDSATQIKVSGDATSIFSNGDSFVIPLYGFATDYAITSSPTYSAGKTTIICSGATFPSDIAGLEIAKIYFITGGETERLVDGGVSPIRFETEGETLNSFLADDVTIVCDNDGGFFYKKDGTGILNIHTTNWVRIYLGYKSDTYRMLYFGGILPREMIDPNKYKKQIKLTAMGFMKELERYPGYEISQENGYFLKLRGVSVKAVTVPSGLSSGVFDLKYIWESKEMQGVSIKEVSSDTVSGIKELKFIYPNNFIWDNGPTTQLTQNTDNQTLTAADGTTITVNCATFDLLTDQAGVRLKIGRLLPRLVDTMKSWLRDVETPEVKDQGRAYLQFNNGPKVQLIQGLQRLIRYDGASYTEETDDNNIPINSFTALTDTNDVLYLFSDAPFSGLEIALDSSSNLAGTISLSYSQGFSSWQSLTGFTDATNNLSQDGSITWDKSDVEGWRKTTIEPSGLTDVIGLYGIKIELSAHTSGSFIPRNINPRIRLYGAYGRTIDINYDYLKFDNESLDEKLIIRQDDSGNWVPANWYRNIPLYQVLDTLLDKTEIRAANRNIDDLAVTTSSNSVHRFSQAPMPFYGKNVTAAIWDSSRSKWWLGVQNELWTFSETEGFQYIDKITRVSWNPYTRDPDEECFISNLVMDSGNNIQGVAWCNVTDNYWKATVFCANTSGITDDNQPSSYYMDIGIQRRDGYYDGSGHRTIGYSSSPARNSGENIVIPFHQRLIMQGIEESVLHDADGLDTGVITGAGRFYFGTNWPSNENSGEIYPCPPGHYFLADEVPAGGDQGALSFRYNLGNPAAVEWNSTAQKWVFFKLHVVTLAKDIIEVDYSGTESVRQSLSAFTQPHILAFNIKSNGDLYYAFMEWVDSGAGTKSRCKLYVHIKPSTNTALFDFSSDSAEASQSITGREAYQTILEMAYNSNEDTIHGCLFDRGNFEYHYFVYDVANDKMYATQLTDPHRQIVNFVMFNNEIHAMVIDRRYREEGSFLIRGIFSGGTITITEYDVINQEENDHAFLVAGNNSLIGNAVGDTGVLWKYGTSFFPLIQYADFEKMDFREIVTEIAELVAFITWINSQRKFNMTTRETYGGTFTFYDDVHLLHNGLAPIGIWPHFYDYVEVPWQSILDDSKGSEIAGTPGWGRRGLTIRNRFITDKFLAAALAEAYYNYFGTARETFQQKTIPLLELEQRDRLNLVYSERRYDIDRSAYFQLMKLELDLNKLILTTNAVGM